VPSDSQDIVAQIKAAQGYSPFDAGPNDEPPHLIGIGEGYLSRRDDAAIPNLADAYPEFVAKSGGGGVPATYSEARRRLAAVVMPFVRRFYDGYLDGMPHEPHTMLNSRF
jgi:hypothetical protein